ncbi:uncharacterized protein LOC126895960 [Daktulosphaira vitifoliae]|uniref:uncharacterized protein LOC126895960 n=1 Tax=Daktulosphaira vitifoliae TaxID=58002 RepID=UPI0021AA3DC5|nr:uncharacterized protein LOC126895960 [Daktulosphaira vitifoliae]
MTSNLDQFHDVKKIDGKCLEQSKNISCLPICENHLLNKKNLNDPYLPKYIDSETVFGIKTKANPLGEVVFPYKLPGQLFLEDTYGTDLYKISHHSYPLGEQVKRNYTNHFNPNVRYGKLNKVLPAGIWFNHEYSNKIQKTKNSENQVLKEMLKVLEKNENSNCRYPYVDNRQGKFIGRSYYGIKDILTGIGPDKNEMLHTECLMNINKLKSYVKRRKCNLRKLYDIYLSLDKENSGWLPKDQVLALCYAHQIRPDKFQFDYVLKILKAIENEKVNYNIFIELIDPNRCLPDALKNSKVFDLERFTTSYKIEYENNITRFANSGISEKKILYNTQRPLINAYKDCFGDETDVKALLNPSIFTNYGLTHRDFYMGRDKNTMKIIFKNIDVHLPDELFDKIWDYAYDCDGYNEKVSLETFRQILEKIAVEMID